MINPDNDLFMKERSLIHEPERIHKCVSRIMSFPCAKLINDPYYLLIEMILTGDEPGDGHAEPFVKDIGELIRRIADYDPDNSDVHGMFRGDADSELRISIVLMQTLLRLIKSLSSAYPEFELLGFVSVRSLLEHYFADPHITGDELLGSMNRLFSVPEDPSVKETVKTSLFSIQDGWNFLSDSLDDFRRKKNILFSSVYFIFVSALLNAAGKEISL